MGAAARTAAGIRPGDRVYRVAGRDFTDDEQFAEWVTTLPGPLEFHVEREGRLTAIVVRFREEAVDRAA